MSLRNSLIQRDLQKLTESLNVTNQKLEESKQLLKTNENGKYMYNLLHVKLHNQIYARKWIHMYCTG